MATVECREWLDMEYIMPTTHFQSMMGDEWSYDIRTGEV